MAVRLTEREARELARRYPHLEALLTPPPKPPQEVTLKQQQVAVSKGAQERVTDAAAVMAALLWLLGIPFGVLFVILNIIAAPFSFTVALIIAVMLFYRR